MNTSEEIFTYRDNTQSFYPQPKKSAYFEYDFTDKPSKKDKKWSFGNLFRRKKKITGGNSDEETKVCENKQKQKDRKTAEAVSETIKTQEIRSLNESRDDNGFTSSFTPSLHTFALYDNSKHSKNQLSSECTNKRTSRVLAKVRAEAKRSSLNQSSSSDEDSQRSSSSSKFKCDKSILKSKDPSLNRKSKASRTERYLRRHSKDSETFNTYSRMSKFSVEPAFLKVSDENLESTSPSPLEFVSPIISSDLGRSTIPLSSANNGRMRNSVNNLSYKPFVSSRESNPSIFDLNQPNSDYLNNQRSISFDADIHRSSESGQIIHAKLELGKPRSRTFTPIVRPVQYLLNREPPLPPPRDPKRLQGPHYLDSINQNTNFESSPPFHNYNENLGPTVRKLNYLNSFPNFKSSSEDHIPQFSPKYQIRRPSSTTPESNIRWNSMHPGVDTHPEDYRYLTDKQCRSRKPIFIQNNSKLIENKEPTTSRSEAKQEIMCNNRKLQAEVFLPSVLIKNEPETAPVSKSENVFEDKKSELLISEVEDKILETKSANLEEALNELEAIYNSLKLGDEDLLDMAEKREQEIVNNKILENKTLHSNWYAPRGALSDSGFSYERSEFNIPRRKRYSQRTLKTDDMAFRKLQRENSPFVANNIENYQSGVTYYNEPDITLDDVVYRNHQQSNKLKVPEHPPPFGIPLGPITLASNSDYLHAIPSKHKESSSEIPDLVKDDLAYRSLRKDNSKTATLPPVSADDLKNNNLCNFSLLKNDSSKIDLYDLRKKRPVRSKSANIGSLLSQEVIEKASRRNAQDKHIENEYRVLSNIADAMHKARQVLKEKEEKLIEHRCASMSDTDSSNLKYTRYSPLRKNILDTKNQPVTRPSLDNFELIKPNVSQQAITKLEDISVSNTPLTTYRETLIATLEKSSDDGTPQNNEFQNSQNIVNSTNLNECVQLSDHDYENIASGDECNMKNDSENDYVLQDLHADLNTFQTANVDNKNESKICLDEPDYCNLISENQEHESHVNSPGEKRVDVEKTAFPFFPSCAFKDSQRCSFDFHCTNDNPTGFFSQIPINRKVSNTFEPSDLNLNQSLKSPKLVLETSKRCHLESNGENKSINDSPLKKRHIPDIPKSSSCWNSNPVTIAIACSYGIACFYHLAASELFALISLVFAVLTLIITFFV